MWPFTRKPKFITVFIVQMKPGTSRADLYKALKRLGITDYDKQEIEEQVQKNWVTRREFRVVLFTLTHVDEPPVQETKEFEVTKWESTSIKMLSNNPDKENESIHSYLIGCAQVINGNVASTKNAVKYLLSKRELVEEWGLHRYYL